MKRRNFTPKATLALLIGVLMSMIFTANVMAATTIEDNYSAAGSAAVSSVIIPVTGQSFTSYKIWYPTNMDAGSYPVIVWSNASNETYSNHESYLSRLASWGFVVIGNDDTSTGKGLTTLEMGKYMIDQNSNNLSIFYNKLNINKIGVGGASQGGSGAINAATKYVDSGIFKSIFTMSTPQLPLVKGTDLEYNPALIDIPYFMCSGTGFVDAFIIAPLASLQNTYNTIPIGVPAVMGRVKNADHDQTIVDKSWGYMTAWFCYTLKDDTVAGTAFRGTMPEIKSNTGRWQDVATKNLP